MLENPIPIDEESDVFNDIEQKPPTEEVLKIAKIKFKEEIVRPPPKWTLNQYLEITSDTVKELNKKLIISQILMENLKGKSMYQIGIYTNLLFNSVFWNYPQSPIVKEYLNIKEIYEQLYG